MQKEVTGAFSARVTAPKQQAVTVIRLSASEAHFVAPQTWSPGTELTLELFLGTDRVPTAVSGVIGRAESESGEFIINVRFGRMEPETRRRIVSFVDDLVVEEYLLEFPKGTVVFQQGDVSKHIYYIAMGRLKVERDGKYVTEITDEDQFVGEISFLLEQPRTATVTTSEDSLLMAIPANVFQKNLSQNPKFGVVLSKLLAKRLQETTRLLAEEKTRHTET